MNPLEWKDITCPGPTWPWVRLFEKEERPRTPRGRPRDPLPEATLAKRVAIINESYSIIDWEPDFSKARIECKNKGQHTSDTGDGQTIIFTGADEMGAISYHCSHTHCESINDEETAWLINRFIEEENIVICNRNTDMEKERRVFLSRARGSGNFYRRGDIHPFAIVHWKSGDLEPIALDPDTFPIATAEEGINFVRELKKGKKPCLPPEREINVILKHERWREFPIVKSYCRRPLLIKTTNGAEIATNQYSKELGIIILPSAGQEEVNMSLDEAVGLFNQLLDFWTFKEPADRSRAAAQLLTPALLQGGFVKRPVPIFLATADQPAAGKTLWHKANGRIYQEKAIPQAYEGGNGIGGINEIIRNTIVRGDTFLFIDELAGLIKSPLLNALITGEDETDCRLAFERMIRASIDHLIVFMAGVKGFVMEEQFASRVMPIRLVKDTYRLAPDGSLLEEWIWTGTKKILGAIYRVIVEWVEKGGRLSPRDSRFPSWSMVVNAILEDILALPHATLGLEHIQANIANEKLNWLEALIKELCEMNLIWNGVGPAMLLKPKQLCRLVNDSGLGFPGEKMNGEGKNRQQCSFISGSIGSLQPVQTGERVTVYNAGDYFVSRYDCGNNGHGKRFFKFSFSNTNILPNNTLDYVSPAEDVIDEGW